MVEKETPANYIRRMVKWFNWQKEYYLDVLTRERLIEIFDKINESDKLIGCGVENHMTKEELDRVEK